MTRPVAFAATSGIPPSDTEFLGGVPLPQVMLADVKPALRKTGSTDDEELIGYLDAARNRIASVCIPLGPATVVDTFDGAPGAGTLILSTFPVNSVTSVTTYDAAGSATILSEAGGSTGLTDGYRKNLSAGTIRRIGYRTWPVGWGNVVVQYTVGPASTPAEVVQAVKVTLQAWWDTRRMTGNLQAPGGATPEAGDLPNPTFGIPSDAYDLLLDYLKPARVA